jgi:O-antigen ligase
MNAKNNLKATDKASNSVWLMILGTSFINLYFHTKSRDPFNTPKLIALLIVSGWLFGHLIKAIKEKPIKLRSVAFYVYIVCGIFLATMLILALFSNLPLVAFVGDTTRRNGFLAYFGLVVILLFSERIMNYEFAIRMLKIATINAFIISIYGLMQTSGHDFVAWNNPYNSILGTVGNPNFASAIMAVLTILSLSILLINEISVLYKIIAFAASIMSVIAIVKSNSRQGLVALLFSVIFYLAIYTYMQRKKIGISFIFIFGMVTSVVILGMLQKGPLASLVYKASVSIRGYYWNAGVEMLKSNPVAGIGIDQYGYYFKEFRNAEYPLKFGYEITSSNAHNLIIQFFATGGIFLGLSYLFLLALIFVLGIKLVKNTKATQQKISLGLLSAWIGYQITSIISIDNIGISVWSWLLGGSILGLSRFKKEESAVNNLNSNQLIKKVQISLFQPVISISILIPLVITSTFLYKSETDTLIVSGYSSDPTKYKDLVFTYANNVINNPLADYNYKLDCAIALIDAGYFNEGFEEIKKLHKINPRNEYILIALSGLSAQRENFTESIEYRIKLARIDPFNAKNYLELLVLYKNTGDLENAKIMLNKILSLTPNSQVAKDAEKVLA